MDNGIFSEEFFKTFYVMHTMAMPFAKTIVFYGGVFCFGKYITRVALMKNKINEAIIYFFRDVFICFAVGYLIGGIGLGKIILGDVDAESMGILNSVGGSSAGWIATATGLIKQVIQTTVGGSNLISAFLNNVPLLIVCLLIGIIRGILYK